MPVMLNLARLFGSRLDRDLRGSDLRGVECAFKGHVKADPPTRGD
jgi:hypothetical protein